MGWEQILIEISLIGFAGFIDAIGGGGGFITIPCFLLIGVPAPLVLGTNKLTVTVGGISAIYRFLRHNRIDLSLMKYGVISALFGAVLGAFLSHLLNAQIMVYILLILVPLILVINTFKDKLARFSPQITLSRSKEIFRCILLSFFIGGYDGIFGPGTGTFLLLGFVFFLYIDYCDASINARLINFISNLSALFYFLVLNKISWLHALIGIPASFIGYWIGSNIVIKGHNRVVRIIVNLVLITLLVHLIFTYLV